MSYYRQHVKTVGKRDKTVPRGGHAAAATGGSPQKKKKPAEFSAGCSFAGGRGAVPLCNKKIAPLSFRHGRGGTLRRLHRPCRAVGDGFAKRCAADAETARRVLLAQSCRDPLTGLFRRGGGRATRGSEAWRYMLFHIFLAKLQAARRPACGSIGGGQSRNCRSAQAGRGPCPACAAKRRRLPPYLPAAAGLPSIPCR